MLHADWPTGGRCGASRPSDGTPRDAEFVRRAKEKFPKFSVRVQSRFITWLSEGGGDAPHAACLQSYSLHVLSTGKIALCCIDGGGQYAVGEILERGVSEIYRASRLRAGFLPRQQMPQPCRHCDRRSQTKLALPGCC